jgi:hypothetical protein
MVVNCIDTQRCRLFWIHERSIRRPGGLEEGMCSLTFVTTEVCTCSPRSRKTTLRYDASSHRMSTSILTALLTLLQTVMCKSVWQTGFRSLRGWCSEAPIKRRVGMGTITFIISELKKRRWDSISGALARLRPGSLTASSFATHAYPHSMYSCRARNQKVT